MEYANASSSNALTGATRTRSIEDSMTQAHDAAHRASHLVSLILDDLNGASPEVAGLMNAGRPDGIVHSADFLASRLENLCSDLQRARSQIVSNNPKSMQDAALAAQDAAQRNFAGRIG